MVTGADDLELAADVNAGSGSGGGTSAGQGGQAGQPVGGGAEGEGEACGWVDCGPHGSCHAVAQEPACVCDDGYHAVGLSCVRDPDPGPCDGVVCGANATCDDGVCFCDQGFEGNPDAGCTPVSPTEGSVRADLINIAMAELGNCEGTNNRPYMQAQPGYWCYDFVAWVYNESSYALDEPYQLPTYDVGSYPQGWTPEPGDLIKFNIQHYGIVKEVSADGTMITTVEGNVSYCVVTRDVELSSLSYFGTLDGEF